MPVCAVLLGANPESFRPKGVPCPTAGQRQSYLRTFRFVQQPAARTIHAPAPYREVLLKIYASLGVTVSAAAPAPPSAAESRTGIKVNDRGYGVIHFDRIGPQAAIELGQALRDVRGLGASSVQLSAPVADPGLPLLMNAARGLGFFFCGLGPAFADGRGHFAASIAERAAGHRKAPAVHRADKRAGGLHRSRSSRNGAEGLRGSIKIGQYSHPSIPAWRRGRGRCGARAIPGAVGNLPQAGRGQLPGPSRGRRSPAHHAE